MKAVITVGDVEQELGNLDELIDNLNKDMSEITQQAEQSIEAAESHLVDRIANDHEQGSIACSSIQCENVHIIDSASRSVYIEWNITAFKSKERLIQ